MNDTAIVNTSTGELADPNTVMFEDMTTTLDMSDPASAVKFVNAFGAAESLSASGVEQFACVGIMQTPGVRKARGAGQADAPCVNTYFFCDDNRTFFTQSDGIARSAKFMMMVPDFFASPRTLKVITHKTSNDNTVKSVMVC